MDYADSVKKPGPYYHPVGVRLQAVALMSQGFHIQHVEAITRMPGQTIKRWVKKARERGFSPAVDQRVFTEYVEDKLRSGRPKGSTKSSEKPDISSAKDRIECEKSSEYLSLCF